MGIANVANMASHLQNASRAKLGLTSVPALKYNIKVAVAMHRAGFISSVSRGLKSPPDPDTLGTLEPEPVTTANVAKQRIWIGLKYYNNEPVLRRMRAITTSRRPVTADLKALERLARGFDASNQMGLGLGECMFVATDRGVLEIREAIERKVGGLLICRCGP